MKELVVHTDGGARGNPGPAGIGVYIATGRGSVFCELSEFIGHKTNNEAEYTAVIRAFEHLIKILNDTKVYSLEFKLDSQLVEKQLKGKYKVKKNHLQNMVCVIKQLELHFNKVTYTHIPRSENEKADALVNQAIDKVLQARTTPL